MNNISSLYFQSRLYSIVKMTVYAVLGYFIALYLTEPTLSPLNLLKPQLLQSNAFNQFLMWFSPILLGYYGWATTIRDRVLADIAVLIEKIEAKQ